MENNEVKETGLITGLGGLVNNSKTRKTIETNITDEKQIFNLENTVDYRINDCKGEKIRVKRVMFKTYETPLDEPVVDVNGEVVKEYDRKIVTILIDDEGKSYVTASKTFAFDLRKYIATFGDDKMLVEGVEIEICEKPVANSANKALSFKLV